jgi:tetratricopeptide (TPR) repeat protein
MKKNHLFPALALLLSLSCFAQDYTYYNDEAKKEYGNKNYLNVIDYANKSLNITANGPAYWWRGMGRYYLNNYSDAASDFNSAISYYSSDNSSLGNLHYWRALCRYSQKNYNDALPDFEQAKNYGYEDKMNLNWYIAYSDYQIAEYQKSKESYSAAISYTSDNTTLSKLYQGRGDAEQKLFENDNAIDDYTKAIEYNSSNSNAFWSRAISRAAKFQNDLAVGDCNSAINILEKQGGSSNDNDLSILYNNRGYYQYLLSRYEEAKNNLRKSLELNPNYSRANYNMGDVLFALKQYKDANRFYLQAASLSKDNASIAGCYNRLYWSSRYMLDYTQALTYINSAIKMTPDQRWYYTNRAYVLAAKKNYPASLADYDKAIELYNSDTSTLVTLYIARGNVKAKIKDNKGALADFQKVVTLNNNYYSSYYELGRFFKISLKQNDLAEINLQKAADLSIEKDTSSSYAYAKVIKGDKQEAFRIIAKLIRKENADNDRLKWELHNAACVYALAGDSNKALQYLDKSFIAGFDDFDHLVNDRDLASLVSLPQYKAILAKYKVPQPK